MTDEQGSPPSNSTPEGAKARRKVKKNQQRSTVVCLICKQVLPRLTQDHLKAHGLTATRYRRMFSGAPTQPPDEPTIKQLRDHAERLHAPATLAALREYGVAPPMAAQSLVGDPTPSETSGDPAEGFGEPQQPPARPLPSPSQQAHAVAGALVQSPEFVATMADEVAEAIFSGPLRDRLKLALVTVLGARMKVHGEAHANLAALRAELSLPWRAQQGGKLGGPTPTEQLLAMASQAHNEVIKSEEAVLKTIKLAVDESKGRDDRAKPPGGLAPYTADAEGIIPIPENMTAEQRETVRELLVTLTRGARLIAATPGDAADAADAAADAAVDLTLTPSINPDPSPQEAPLRAEAHSPSPSILQVLAEHRAEPSEDRVASGSKIGREQRDPMQGTDGGGTQVGGGIAVGEGIRGGGEDGKKEIEGGGRGEGSITDPTMER